MFIKLRPNNLPWTESWPRASSLPAQGSTDCRKVPCPPCRGPPHWQSQKIHRLSAAPGGSRWRGPARACSGRRPHGNCSRSWRGGRKGRARVRMSRFINVRKWLVFCEWSHTTSHYHVTACVLQSITNVFISFAQPDYKPWGAEDRPCLCCIVIKRTRPRVLSLVAGASWSDLS